MLRARFGVAAFAVFLSVCAVQLAEQPGHPKALSVRASCFTKKKLYAQARARSSVSIVCCFSDPAAAAASLLQAVDDYSTLITLNPEDKAAFWNRGVAHDKLGLTNEAIAGAAVLQRGARTGCSDCRSPRILRPTQTTRECWSSTPTRSMLPTPVRVRRSPWAG